MDARDRMDRRPYAPWVPWAITSVLLVLVAIAAYLFGAQQQAAAAGEPVRRVWFGFPGFWLFIIFWMVFGTFRRMLWWHWWGGGWGPWGPWYGYRRWRSGRYDDHPYDDERAEWEAWHRREHQRVDRPPSGGDASSSNADRRPIT